MLRYYQRREKLQGIPELRPFRAETLAPLPDDTKLLGQSSIQVYFYEGSASEFNPLHEKFSYFREVTSALGYSLLLPQYFVYAIAVLISRGLVQQGVFSLPVNGKKDLGNLFTLVKDYLDHQFKFYINKGDPWILLPMEGVRVSLINEFISNHVVREIYNKLAKNQLAIRYANYRSHLLQLKNKNMFFLLTHAPIEKYSLTLVVADNPVDVFNSRKYHDAALKLSEFTEHNIRSLSKEHKTKIKRKVNAPKVSGFYISNTLNAKVMPHHPIFHALKHQLEPYIFGYQADTLFDPMDLLYQVSFRLTCYSLGEIFVDYNGDYLEPNADMLERMTAIMDYNYVRQYAGVDWGRYTINYRLVDALIGEQLTLAKERYEQSKTDVSRILGHEGILADNGWHLVSQQDQILCVNEASDKVYRVEFREIEPALAYDYHKTYHYIHAPRVERSFGLFLQGSEQPFTIAGIDWVDRDYKKEALLILGYDYEKCVDFTRLYSLPGVPKLSSSIISKRIKRQLLMEQPNMQAAISTFMPTYANGNSMFACGFDKVFLLKRNRHKFVERTELGTGIYEHLTNRRAGETAVIANRQVLLPVVELLSEIKKPRFKPYIDITKQMMIRPE